MLGAEGILVQVLMEEFLFVSRQEAPSPPRPASPIIIIIIIKIITATITVDETSGL